MVSIFTFYMQEIELAAANCFLWYANNSWPDVSTLAESFLYAVFLYFSCLKGTRCLGSVELVFEKFVTVCYIRHMVRKMF